MSSIKKPESQIEMLTKLGLTQNQAKIYLANLKTGCADVKTIAQIAQINREDVYRLLPSLYEKGLIKKYIGSPTTYEPVKPSKSLPQLISNKLNEFSELKSKVLDFIATEPKEDEYLDKSEFFLMIPNLLDAIHKLTDAIKNTKETWLFTSGYERFIMRQNMAEKHQQVKEMLKAVQRGVKIKAILDMPKNRKRIPADSLELNISKALINHKNFEYRYTDSKHQGLFSIFDDRLTFIETKQGSTIMLPQLWSNNKVLLGLTKALFESAWDSSYIPE